MQKRWVFAMALLLQLSVTLGLGVVVAYIYTHDRAPSGLIAWGKDFSGLSRIQVSAQLKNEIPNAVSYKEHVYPLKMDRSDAEIEAWSKAITGTFFYYKNSPARTNKIAEIPTAGSDEGLPARILREPKSNLYIFTNI